MNESTTGTETTSAPTSFAEAAATLEASSASTPESTSPTAETPAPAATTQAADQTTDPAAEGVSATPETKRERLRRPDGTFAPGVPPESEWPRILENQRKTAGEEAAARVRQEYEQQYGWAKHFSGMSPEEVQGAVLVSRAMRGDQQAIAHIAQTAPDFARANGWIKDQPADAMPEPDLQSADGTLVYSASQMQKLREWDQRRLMQQFEQTLGQKLQPLEQVRAAHEQAVAHSTIASVIAKMEKADPEFAKYKADIGQTLRGDAKLWALADTDPETAMEIAWSRVHRDKVLPTLSQQSRAAVLAEMNTKAAATTVNPGHGTVSLPKKPKDFFEAAALMANGR